MKKHRFLIGVLVIVSLFCFGVGGAIAQKVVLELPSYQANEPGFGDWWKVMVEQFRASHPNVEIKLIPAPFEAHHQNLTARFSTGNPPDIVHLSARYYYRFADLGWLEPLDELLAQTDVPTTWSPLQESMKWEGKTYALLLLGYGYGLFYNQKMFEEAGIDVPTNIPELLEAANALTKDTNGDGRIDQYGIVLTVGEFSPTYMNTTWMLIGNGTHWTDENGELQLTKSSVVKETLEQWRQIVKAGWTPAGYDDAAARKFFTAGNAAMLIDGSWVAAMVREAEPAIQPYLQVARVPFDNIPSGPSNVVAMPAGLSPEKKQIVWEFIRSLTTPEAQLAYTELTGSPAPRMGAVPEHLLEESLGMEVFAQAIAEAKESFMPKGYEADFAEFSDIVVRGLMKLAVTDAKIEDVLREVENEIRQQLPR